MNNIILDSLDYFFKSPHVSCDMHKLKDIEGTMPLALVNKKKMRYNIIGTVYKESKKFTWAWHLNSPKIEYVKTKQLLIYGVNMDVKTLEDAYIKTLLTSSTIDAINDKNIVMILSLVLYLSKAHSLTKIEHDDYTLYIGLYDVNDSGETSV